LVTGADPGPVVPVKIFMELNQVSPTRIVLKLSLTTIDWSALAISQEDAYKPA
jgi:hypothetical protein